MLPSVLLTVDVPASQHHATYGVLLVLTPPEDVLAAIEKPSESNEVSRSVFDASGSLVFV